MASTSLQSAASVGHAIWSFLQSLFLLIIGGIHTGFDSVTRFSGSLRVRKGKNNSDTSRITSLSHSAVLSGRDSLQGKRKRASPVVGDDSIVSEGMASSPIVSSKRNACPSLVATSGSQATGKRIPGGFIRAPVIPALPRIFPDMKDNSAATNRPATSMTTEMTVPAVSRDIASKGAATATMKTENALTAAIARLDINKSGGVVKHGQHQQIESAQQQKKKENDPDRFFLAQTAGQEPATAQGGGAGNGDAKRPLGPVIPVISPHYTERERAIHTGFIQEALDMARLALRTNETPVGCVLVRDGCVIAKGMNATNVTRNGTRHAELMAVTALLSYTAESKQKEKSKLHPAENPSKGKKGKNKNKHTLGHKTDLATPMPDPRQVKFPDWRQPIPDGAWEKQKERVQKGHIYPYGHKLIPLDRVDKAIIAECTLYVTVEPCVMCASLLRQLRIKKVFFGAVNDKFGGTGGVFRIHQNSAPLRHDMASAPPSPTHQKGVGLERAAMIPRPGSAIDGMGSPATLDDAKDGGGELAVANAGMDILEGDGGIIEPGYEAEGGWGRDEAVTLLRQFYVQENNRAPVPRKKEGRAARLQAMMERDGHAGGPMIQAESLAGDTSAGQTPIDEVGEDDAMLQQTVAEGFMA